MEYERRSNLKQLTNSTIGFIKFSTLGVIRLWYLNMSSWCVGRATMVCRGLEDCQLSITAGEANGTSGLCTSKDVLEEGEHSHQ